MKTISPFSLTYTPNIPEILLDLNFTLALSTYQAGKVVFISAIDRDKLIQLPRTFDNAMGLATSENKLAVACKKHVIELKNFPALAHKYPGKEDTYDAMFVPSCKYFTGSLDLHDMNFLDGKLLAINTLFSCISEVNSDYSFHPVWNPDFISELSPEDRCHLNGMAIKDERIEYVTALGATNEHHGWRKNKMQGGVILHVPSGEVVLSGLSMPHSPRIYNNKLFFLNSAQGELRIADTVSGTSDIIAKLGGFTRGMARMGDYLFIGISKLRHTTKDFSDLPISKSSFAGIVVVYLPLGKPVGEIRYESSVDEVYDVKILPGLKRPGILNEERIDKIIPVTTPNDTYWSVSD
jgi:uncharacterized protein (TIGR03032 family)